MQLRIENLQDLPTYLRLYLHNPAKQWQIYCINIAWVQSISYLTNQWCCFTDKAAFISLHQGASESAELLDDRASEAITITSDRQQPSLQLSTCVSQHPESLRVTSTHLSSPTQSSGCCDSPAAMGASILAQTLILVDFTFNPQFPIRCATHILWLISCRISSKCRPGLRNRWSLSEVPEFRVGKRPSRSDVRIVHLCQLPDKQRWRITKLLIKVTQ